ncbi:hypothetical protein BHM03_00013565 [Ensete ventricosum]|nr:hypothetical protein BHM03_00013565 [Ensete ventricosum]
MAFPRTTPTPTSARSWCSGRGFPRTPCTLSPSSSSSAPSSSGSSPPTVPILPDPSSPFTFLPLVSGYFEVERCFPSCSIVICFRCPSILGFQQKEESIDLGL